MTPEERDRLVRLEEQVIRLRIEQTETKVAIRDESMETRERIEEVRAHFDRLENKISDLSTTFGALSAFGKGSVWAVTKLAALIGAIIVVVDWLMSKWPLLK